MALDLESLYGTSLIIVASVRNGRFKWYASWHDMWNLEAWLEDEDSAERHLRYLKEDKVSTEELRVALANVLPADRWLDIEHLGPSLFVDFDNRHLISVYWENVSLEALVPLDWCGECDPTFRTGGHAQFFSRIPIQHRYWIINGEDVFQKWLSEPF